ncbi:MAG: NAD/NADP octopine/nopaline dehydrogenase family protein [Candidatus Rokubacteria bacterium]|nr:NAD/NADP octopine/nopaline dehydrogenase family protein [Candidatus Rokubacteria bacterium]
MNVAVLGGSNGAFAAAGDLTLAGHAVRLWRRTDADLAPVRAAGGITLRADERHGLARLDTLTADLDAALAGADVVLVALPATTHEALAPELAKRLTETQIVLMTPGTFGAFAMARDVGRARGRLPLAFAETGTLPWLARKTGPAEVSAPVRAENLPVGVFPASRTAEVVGRLRELFPALRPCTDVLDAALTNAGTVIHPPLVLLNAGAIDAGRFDIHATGTTASARKLIDAVDAERVAAREGWRYPAPHYELATYYEEARAAEGLYGAGAKARLVASGLWSETLTFEHRYVTEDAALGLPLLESAARTVGVPTPTATGLLHLFGVLLGRPLGGRGRALESHGLGDFAVREIRELLHAGWPSTLWAQALR